MIIITVNYSKMSGSNNYYPITTKNPNGKIKITFITKKWDDFKKMN